MTLDQAKRRFPPMWTVYRYPRDFPGWHVVRTWYGDIPTDEVSLHHTLFEAREYILDELGGSAALQRSARDVHCVVETWL